MKRKVKIVVANPAGNITIFVKDSFSRSNYSKVGEQLLAMKELKGEQVSFIKEPKPFADACMEMCGLEFCGNASRSLGLMCAREKGIKGEGKVKVSVSGCDEILEVAVNTETNFTRIKMPSPVGMWTENCGIDVTATMVDFGGILHVVLDMPCADINTFERIKAYVNDKYNPPAMGVMFYDKENSKLTPIVYVKDVDSTYFEGSCGSGSTACAAAFSKEKPDGSYTYILSQPAGVISATAIVEKGKPCDVYIEGPVLIGEDMEVEIDI